MPKTIAYINEEPTDIANAEALIGPIHKYADVQIASILNKLRVCTMFASWIVMNCLEWLTPEPALDSMWQYSRYVEQTTIDDICSSVPFHLNWESPERKTKAPDQVEIIADLVGGLSLVWPLGGAACSLRASAKQKAWIWGRLRTIADECGLEQASLLDTNVKDVLESFLNRPPNCIFSENADSLLQ